MGDRRWKNGAKGRRNRARLRGDGPSKRSPGPGRVTGRLRLLHNSLGFLALKKVFIKQGSLFIHRISVINPLEVLEGS